MTWVNYDALRENEVRWAGADPRRRWLVNKAYEMRLSPTSGELAMWRILNDMEIPFTPQAIIGGRFIVDFLIEGLSLCIEVDGGIHLTQAGKDQRRERAIADMGFRGMRFTNQDVLEGPEEVCRGLWDYLYELAGAA